MNELLYYDLKETSGVTPGLAIQISRELGRRIVAGSFPEGGLIDDENRLCSRFGVSKSVVREAIKLLVSKGLLEVRRGSGTRVRRRASWNLLDDDVLAWHQGIEPKPEFLRQLMDVRQIVEPNAAGSGIPETCAFLNGVIIPKTFSLRVVFAKFASCALAVGSGIPAGPEGPM